MLKRVALLISASLLIGCSNEQPIKPKVDDGALKKEAETHRQMREREAGNK